MLGAVNVSPQSEATVFNPNNPYGVSKLFAHQMCELYRNRGVFAVSGILFNHESPRRGENFVTSKIVRTLTEIKLGKAEILELGNLDSMRDWSFAGDVMEGAWQSLQTDVSASYVFASGQAHSVRDFVNATAKRLGLELLWSGEGVGEVACDTVGVVRVKVNPQFFRPVEKCVRVGDIGKIESITGWKPKTSFDELVGMMVDAEEVKRAK
jgi:GDPmannose 4,6-dehydratase